MLDVLAEDAAKAEVTGPDMDRRLKERKAAPEETAFRYGLVGRRI